MRIRISAQNNLESHIHRQYTDWGRIHKGRKMRIMRVQNSNKSDGTTLLFEGLNLKSDLFSQFAKKILLFNYWTRTSVHFLGRTLVFQRKNERKKLDRGSESGAIKCRFIVTWENFLSNWRDCGRVIQLNGKITDVSHFAALQAIKSTKNGYFSSFLVQFFLPFLSRPIYFVIQQKIKTPTTKRFEKINFRYPLFVRRIDNYCINRLRILRCLLSKCRYLCWISTCIWNVCQLVVYSSKAGTLNALFQFIHLFAFGVSFAKIRTERFEERKKSKRKKAKMKTKTKSDARTNTIRANKNEVSNNSMK